METNKQITINIPDGYIIDEEKSILKEGNIVFKKKEVVLPKTWKEAAYILLDSELNNLWNLTKISTKYSNLRRLEILRDIYRQGWKPDWTIDDNKYVINYLKGKIYITSYHHSSEFLSFQSEEIRNEFLKNFKDLIEKCKNFI